MLLARFAQGANVFNRTRNILTFIFLAGIISTAAGATMGTITLYLGSFIARPEVSTVWLTWWLGDAVGNLIITPLLLMWLTHRYCLFDPGISSAGCRFVDGGGFDVGAVVSQPGSRWLGVFCSRTATLGRLALRPKRRGHGGVCDIRDCALGHGA